MSKILIVAGAGFLGKSLFHSLKASGFNDLTCADITHPEIEFVKYINVNVLEKEKAQKFKGAYDIIINCSGQITNPINVCYNLNTAGTSNLVESIKNTSTKLVQISSVAVFGTAEKVDESSIFNPETPYSCCKAFAEYLIKKELPSNQYCILRLSNLYGLTQQKGILSYLFRSYQTDRRLNFNNDGSLIRYYLNVDDCADIIAKALLLKNFPSGDYNIPGNDRYSVTELIKLFEGISGSTFNVKLEPVKPYDNALFISSEKISSVLPLTFNYSVKKYFEKRLSKI